MPNTADQAFEDKYVLALRRVGEVDENFKAWKTPTGEVYYGENPRPIRTPINRGVGGRGRINIPDPTPTDPPPDTDPDPDAGDDPDPDPYIPYAERSLDALAAEYIDANDPETREAIVVEINARSEAVDVGPWLVQLDHDNSLKYLHDYKEFILDKNPDLYNESDYDDNDMMLSAVEEDPSFSYNSVLGAYAPGTPTYKSKLGFVGAGDTFVRAITGATQEVKDGAQEIVDDITNALKPVTDPITGVIDEAQQAIKDTAAYKYGADTIQSLEDHLESLKTQLGLNENIGDTEYTYAEGVRAANTFWTIGRVILGKVNPVMLFVTLVKGVFDAFQEKHAAAELGEDFGWLDGMVAGFTGSEFYQEALKQVRNTPMPDSVLGPDGTFQTGYIAEDLFNLEEISDPQQDPAQAGMYVNLIDEIVNENAAPAIDPDEIGGDNIPATLYTVDDDGNLSIDINGESVYINGLQDRALNEALEQRRTLTDEQYANLTALYDAYAANPTWDNYIPYMVAAQSNGPDVKTLADLLQDVEDAAATYAANPEDYNSYAAADIAQKVYDAAYSVFEPINTDYQLQADLATEEYAQDQLGDAPDSAHQAYEQFLIDRQAVEAADFEEFQASEANREALAHDRYLADLRAPSIRTNQYQALVQGTADWAADITKKQNQGVDYDVRSALQPYAKRLPGGDDEFTNIVNSINTSLPRDEYGALDRVDVNAVVSQFRDYLQSQLADAQAVDATHPVEDLFEWGDAGTYEPSISSEDPPFEEWQDWQAAMGLDPYSDDDLAGIDSYIPWGKPMPYYGDYGDYGDFSDKQLSNQITREMWEGVTWHDGEPMAFTHEGEDFVKRWDAGTATGDSTSYDSEPYSEPSGDDFWDQQQTNYEAEQQADEDYWDAWEYEYDSSDDGWGSDSGGDGGWW